MRLSFMVLMLLASICSHAQSGMASYYHDKFHGNKTASGEKYSQYKLTAAHRTLPFGTRVKVTNPETKKSVIVTINDRGPFGGGIIDLSKSAARQIGLTKRIGTCKVKLKVLK